MKAAIIAVSLCLASALGFADGETNSVVRAKVEEAESAAVEVFSVQPIPPAEDVGMEASAVTPVACASPRGEWQDKIEAPDGSRAHWILFSARKRAARSEDTACLRGLFAATLQKWMSDPDDAKRPAEHDPAAPGDPEGAGE